MALTPPPRSAPPSTPLGTDRREESDGGEIEGETGGRLHRVYVPLSTYFTHGSNLLWCTLNYCILLCVENSKYVKFFEENGFWFVEVRVVWSLRECSESRERKWDVRMRKRELCTSGKIPWHFAHNTLWKIYCSRTHSFTTLTQYETKWKTTNFESHTHTHLQCGHNGNGRENGETGQVVFHRI